MSTPSPRREQASTRAAFFIPGFMVACWAPLVPFAKARASLSEAGLGTVLLCLGLGSLFAMTLAGRLVARHGCRRVMVVSAAGMVLAMPLLAVGATPLSLGALLFVFGGCIGAMDCAMNLQAVVVERESGRSMMSGFHAWYSIGGLVGAACAALLLATRVAPLAAAVALALAAGATALPAIRGWRTEPRPDSGPGLALPHGVVAVVGTVCFITFMAEGSMLDWSAVYLHQVRHIELAQAGWGFVAFNVAMTTMRLLGDRVVDALGRPRAVMLGGLVASGGLLLVTLAPTYPASMAGFVLIGTGCANIVPVMFTLAGNQHSMPEHLAIPAVTTLGYAGVLAGPALIGFIAQQSSLSTAFLLSASALAVVAFVGASVARPAARA